VLDDHRPRQRGDERVLAFVERVRAQCGDDEVVREFLARVDHLHLDGPRRDRARADRLFFAVRELPHVDRTRDDLDTPLLPQPPDGDGGVEPS